MLELAGIHVDRGVTPVLKGVTLTVGEGEAVALIGANGAGKSTTLQTISGLLRPRAGTIRFRAGGAEHDLARLPAQAIVAAGVVHCPEGRHVFGALTVAENLAMGAYLRRDRAALARDEARVLTLFPILAERRAMRAGSLSGGEQMMLAIGRALLAAPRLLLLDEPSLGLAPRMVETIFDVLLDLRRDGVTLLLVEQNAAMALEVADRGYVLDSGIVTMAGSAAELAADDRVRHAYLGIPA